MPTPKPSRALPDWSSPPGETIVDALEERGWSPKELAERTGLTGELVEQLLNGAVEITEDTALALERVLGSTTEFWLRREALYREGLLKEMATLPSQCEQEQREPIGQNVVTPQVDSESMRQ